MTIEPALEALHQLLFLHGITAPVEWNTDKPMRDGSQWFIGKSFQGQGKTNYIAWFGDYKTALKTEWKSWDKATKEEAKHAAIYIEDLVAKEAAARVQVQMQAAVDAEAEFKKFGQSGTTPYMARKNIKELYGTRIKDNSPNSPILCIPLRDVEGTFWNFQRIYAEKLSAGDKFYYDGAKVDGCFHVLTGHGESTSGRPTFSGRVFVCEGFATAATVKEAFPNDTVVAALTAGNLHSVCVAIKEAHPSADITVCADNDAYTIIQGKHVNVGLTKGRRAAGAVGGKCVWPVFKHPAKGFTDFNDLKAAQGNAAAGLELVRDQIEHPENYVEGIQPMCLPVNGKGLVKTPSEKQVCEYVLEFFKDRMIRQDKSIFVYQSTHWTELDVMGIDRLKQMINVAANSLLDSRDLSNYYNFLLVHCPQVPFGTNFYQPNPYAANFQNGTLHIQGKEIVFRKHSADDYLTSVLPFDCGPEGETPGAPRLDRMLNRLFDGRPDKDEAIALAHELIGACFMPAFPVIAIFYGRPLSGKSTLIKFLVKLVSRENVCSVQLCDMHGFNMETMVGKLVNYDTDIDVNRPMNDSEVKKITDREPRRIRRKGLRDAVSYLPAVHLFAGNALPKSLDGASHAYGRRIILVHTDNAITEEPEEDFEQKILEEEMPGVVARGLEGLRRRLRQGKYTISAQSKERVRAMEDDSDVVGEFFVDALNGELDDKGKALVADNPVEIAKRNDYVSRPQLWTIFDNWQDASVKDSRAKLKKSQFMSRLEIMGYAVRKQDGVYRVMGLRFGGPVGLG